MYSLHARYVLAVFFGNFQGAIDVYNRQNKVSNVTTSKMQIPGFVSGRHVEGYIDSYHVTKIESR